jgi:hypothetical protein
MVGQKVPEIQLSKMEGTVLIMKTKIRLYEIWDPHRGDVGGGLPGCDATWTSKECTTSISEDQSWLEWT